MYRAGYLCRRYVRQDMYTRQWQARDEEEDASGSQQLQPHLSRQSEIPSMQCV